MANTKDERLPHLTVACCTPLYGLSIYICSGTLLSRAGFMTFSNPAVIVLMMGSASRRAVCELSGNYVGTSD